MNLAIDIGNSFTHFAVYNGSKQVYCHKSRLNEPNGLKNILLKIANKYPPEGTYFKQDDLHKITSIGISSVSPSTYEYISNYAINIFKIKPLTINNKTKLPVVIKINNPVTIGTDRICNAVFGYEYFKRKHNVLIIDIGTANTFDIVTIKGEFVGGIIAPGIMISSKALNTNTGKLPLIEYSKLSFKSPLIGKNTFEAISSGLVNYMIFATEGIVSAVKKHFNGKLKVIITGGSSNFLINNVNFKYTYIQNTVLDGINCILNYQNSTI